RPWSHFAVLTRTNAQTLLFEVALRDARIPFRVRGGGGFLHQPEIKAALAALAGSPRGVPFTGLVADLEAMAAGDDGTEERRLSLQSLALLARDYAALDGDPSPVGFAAWLAVTVKGDEPERGGDAVEIATFHRAKGLEWPVVHVAGLERGLVPILGGRADTPEGVAEERRLLYVALTRARDELHCSWAERRSFSGRAVTRSPSPWLADVEAAVDGMRRAGAPPPDGRARLEHERARLRSASGGRPRPVRIGLGSDPDPEMFAALKEWRARTARAASVPAHVIFHDTTLAAVAELRPGTREALLAVPGLGPVKAERYGDALLAMVAGLTRAG
ncbi:MAG TPA: 3'-5' exonuclease, partial [Acidimicrobiales bacterium]|nr:3'-5' exonuclease [Acidimicrobiales bacterium]